MIVMREEPASLPSTEMENSRTSVSSACATPRGISKAGQISTHRHPARIIRRLQRQRRGPACRHARLQPAHAGCSHSLAIGGTVSARPSCAYTEGNEMAARGRGILYDNDCDHGKGPL